MRTPGPAFDLRAALSAELRAAAEELKEAAPSKRAVHQCRVRIKRARALARVGRACAPGLSSVFVDSARALMRNLALARDPAALSEAAMAAARKGGKKTAGALRTAARGLEEAAAVSPKLNIESARAGLKDLLALAQVWPEASERQIRRGARRIERRARRARRQGRGAADPERRHQWRSREKDRYYATLMLGPSWPGKRRRSVAEELGDVLGKERDALLLMERLLAAPALAGEAEATARALRALNKQRAKYARRADKLGARMSARP